MAETPQVPTGPQPKMLGQHTTRQERDGLEALIDRVGLPAVCEALAEIASGKADHIREAWQDERLARGWDRAAEALLAAEVKTAAVIGWGR